MLRQGPYLHFLKKMNITALPDDRKNEEFSYQAPLSHIAAKKAINIPARGRI
jgi:hypothetical protein